MTKNKILILIALLFISGLGAYYIFNKNKSSAGPMFTAEKPFRKKMTQYINAAGTLKAKEEITVGSLVAGRVIKVLAGDNAFVKRDQILVELDDGVGDSAVKAVKAQINQIEDKLEYQKNFYARQKALYAVNQISKDTFEQYTSELKILEDQLKQTKAELEIRQKEYDNLFIKSPDDGVVIARTVDLGQMITSRFQATELYKIAKNLKEMEAHVDVDEADIGMIKEGQPATFRVDAFPKEKFRANVKQIKYLAKVIDGVVTYATILNVTNPDLKLRPGMTTNVDIKVAKELNALAVPNKALRIDDAQLEEVAKKLNYTIEKEAGIKPKKDIDSLWILENKKFKQIKVTTGVKQDKYTEIKSNNVNETTDVITEITEITRDNKLLQQMFARPGTIGSTKK
jgi:HlyD family secretion protein